jgi:hypothetical protein
MTATAAITVVGGRWTGINGARDLAAALIMVCVFGAFILGDDRSVKIVGFALAAAVFIDATVVRADSCAVRHGADGQGKLVGPEVAGAGPPDDPRRHLPTGACCRRRWRVLAEFGVHSRRGVGRRPFYLFAYCTVNIPTMSAWMLHWKV